MIDILNIDETKPFATKILNKELIRTGTNSYGSCFFYSIYMPFKYFRTLSEEQKKDFILKKRQELADRIEMEEWFCIQSGHMAFLQIIESMRKIIHTIKEILLEEDNIKYIQQYNLNSDCIKILFTLLNTEIIEKDILPEWDIECSNTNSSEYLESIKSAWFAIYKNRIMKAIDELENELDPQTPRMTLDKKQKVIQKLSLLSYPIFDFIASRALHDFKEDIKNPQKWLNIFIFASVLQYMDININILIIDYETGMPYEGMKLIYKKENFENDHPFVVILYFKDMHFESLGQKTILNNKTVINRLFRKDDPFIITCLSYLDNEL